MIRQTLRMIESSGTQNFAVCEWLWPGSKFFFQTLTLTGFNFVALWSTEINNASLEKSWPSCWHIFCSRDWQHSIVLTFFGYLYFYFALHKGFHWFSNNWLSISILTSACNNGSWINKNHVIWSKDQAFQLVKKVVWYMYVSKYLVQTTLVLWSKKIKWKLHTKFKETNLKEGKYFCFYRPLKWKPNKIGAFVYPFMAEAFFFCFLLGIDQSFETR